MSLTQALEMILEERLEFVFNRDGVDINELTTTEIADVRNFEKKEPFSERELEKIIEFLILGVTERGGDVFLPLNASYLEREVTALGNLNAMRKLELRFGEDASHMSDETFELMYRSCQADEQRRVKAIYQSKLHLCRLVFTPEFRGYTATQLMEHWITPPGETKKLKNKKGVMKMLPEEFKMFNAFNKDRRFGIELEIVCYSSPVELRDAMLDRGLATVIDTITSSSYGDKWKITMDSSIGTDFSGENADGEAFGIEIVSPPLLLTTGLEKIKLLYEVLEDVGYSVEVGDCALHIHIEGLRQDMRGIHHPKHFILLTEFMFLLEKEIMLYQPKRRRKMRYCESLELEFVWDMSCLGTLTEGAKSGLLKQEDVRDLFYRTQYPETDTKYNGKRYRGLNLHSLWYRDTVEFRYFKTPTDMVETFAWLYLCYFIIETVVNHRLDVVHKYYKTQVPDKPTSNNPKLIGGVLEEFLPEEFASVLKVKRANYSQMPDLAGFKWFAFNPSFKGTSINLYTKIKRSLERRE